MYCEWYGVCDLLCYRLLRYVLTIGCECVHVCLNFGVAIVLGVVSMFVV